jgi:hypothetical protein
MRLLAVGLALCGLLSWSVALAEEGKAKEKNKTITEISLKDLKLGEANGKATAPTMITSAKELAKAIPDEDAQKAIAKKVDFDKVQLLYFAWSGSGGDKVSYEVTGKKKEVVVFSFAGGRTRDLRAHYLLYALDKDAKWEFAEK